MIIKLFPSVQPFQLLSMPTRVYALLKEYIECCSVCTKLFLFLFFLLSTTPEPEVQQFIRVVRE